MSPILFPYFLMPLCPLFPLFPYSLIPLFPYSRIPVFRIPVFPYSVLPRCPYSNNSCTGCPVQPEGYLIFNNAEIVGATSVILWNLTEDPFFIPFPKKRIGTCVSYL